MNNIQNVFIQTFKDKAAYKTMQDRAAETGFDNNMMSLETMKKTGESYIKDASRRAAGDLTFLLVQWIGGSHYAKATPDGVNDAYDFGKTLYKGYFGTDFEYDAKAIWNNTVKETKQSLKNLKYEFNKGINQLRNMPVNMR